ncbi:hypothetical protein GA0116948_11174 [Chitinophaga costaii]|uniref:Uncharacterized protein n=1 Tax=Chitinophaga costaii TaxID=1335309 RepID=A0A1C4F304_9BACT|nr:hypothetical protein [Chitinophaga costaii]SCC50234.1 hypothetical protein GA0116948_11174 [Chitinophaga costaii]
MNIKTTPASLAKLEKIFEEAKYVLRFEKGTFNSGYCILEHKRVVVINKFLNLEGRINSLLDILPTITLDESMLTSESLKLYYQVVESKAQLLADAEAAARGEIPAPSSTKGSGKKDKNGTANTASLEAASDEAAPEVNATSETGAVTNEDAGTAQATPGASDHAATPDAESDETPGSTNNSSSHPTSSDPL